MNGRKAAMLTGGRIWMWFLLLSLLMGLCTALLSGSLQLKRNMRAGASLEAFVAHMEERIPALMRLYRVPGCSMALVHSGEIQWTQAYGYADAETGRALTPDTPMSVQSISKPVTAWGVMRLAEKGLMDLDAPVTRYLTSWQFPHSNHPAEKVTIRHLLNHTAGMPLGDFTAMYSPGEPMPSLRERLTQEAVLAREPGAAFSYSNVGFNLLELVIQEATGRDFSEYIRSEVLLPLGMERASFLIDGAMTPYPPTGYNLAGKPVPVYVYPEKASGGLFATAEDIARFAAAGMKENPVLSAESVGRMYIPESHHLGMYGLVFDAYGLGHYLETLPNGLRSVSHGGQGNGIMTHFQAVPETGDAIVILTNSQRSWPLIAYLLSDWARWRSFPNVGMGRILWGHYGLSAAVGMLLSGSMLMILRWRRALYRAQQAGMKAFRLAIALLVLGILLWCAFQKHLFLTVVFPILSPWLGAAALVFAIVLLTSAVMPSRQKGK